MGTTNMDEFIKKYKLHNYLHIEQKPNVLEHVSSTKKPVAIEVYYCKCCKYYTEKFSHFKYHLESKKHISLSKENCDDKIDAKQFKRKIYCCDKCDKFYTSNQSLINHKKNCY